MKKEIIEMADMFKILSNEVRLCIITDLCLNGEKKVRELQNCSGASQSFVSQQLAKLKAMGVVKDRKEGSEVYYSLKDNKMCSFIKNLDLTNK